MIAKAKIGRGTFLSSSPYISFSLFSLLFFSVSFHNLSVSLILSLFLSLPLSLSPSPPLSFCLSLLSPFLLSMFVCKVLVSAFTQTASLYLIKRYPNIFCFLIRLYKQSISLICRCLISQGCRQRN